jgi:hypothetical protein
MGQADRLSQNLQEYTELREGDGKYPSHMEIIWFAPTFVKKKYHGQIIQSPEGYHVLVDGNENDESWMELQAWKWGPIYVGSRRQLHTEVMEVNDETPILAKGLQLNNSGILMANSRNLIKIAWEEAAEAELFNAAQEGQ